MGLVEIPPGGSIPAHDETERDQEEVFIVLSGLPCCVIDDQEHPAPAGTFARIDPALRRHVEHPAPTRQGPDRLGTADERLRADGVELGLALVLRTTDRRPAG